MLLKLSDKLWVGNTKALEFARDIRATALVNVASDLSPLGSDSSYLMAMKSMMDMNKVEYAQVGLVDGPGNEVTDYCAAVLFLKSVVRRHDTVLVYDHGGGRALAVGAMYVNLTEGQHRAGHNSWSHWLGWVERVERLVVDRYDTKDGPGDMPKVHYAHVKAFGMMPWGILAVL